MSAEFIKLISDLHSERFNAHLGQLATNQTPVGIFFGFIMKPSEAVTNLQKLVKVGLNVTCAIVLADRQAEVLKNFVDVPVVALEDISILAKKISPPSRKKFLYPIIFRILLSHHILSATALSRFSLRDKPKIFWIT